MIFMGLSGRRSLSPHVSSMRALSISAVSWVQSLILPEERWGGGGMSAAHFPEQQLVIEPNSRPKLHNF